jgi:endoglucanase
MRKTVERRVPPRVDGLRSAVAALLLLGAATHAAAGQDAPLALSAAGVFEGRGVSVLVFHNWYSGMFSDSKLSGVELVHHGVRTATNGDVRLSNTPEQWDPIPQFSGRETDRDTKVVRASLTYPDFGFAYRVDVRAAGAGVLVSVHLDSPLPKVLEGRAGFNLEFLPSAYFDRTYMVDGRGHAFPRAAGGAMYRDSASGALETAPLAMGTTLVLAPEDPERRVTIEAHGTTLALYDGRNRAQNGWFVVRSLLPAGRTGTVIEWMITPKRNPAWARPPVIAHSQVGYYPDQVKVAVLECDPNDTGPDTVRLLQISPAGALVPKLVKAAAPWGRYLRYDYSRFDFSEVQGPGLYVIEFRGARTEPFPIAGDVYDGLLWQTTLDTYLAVQMDHMYVTDRYRVWHGAAHLDDARQAPPDHEHFDLYRQGPTLDSPFQAGEHIPGLNVGGWFDAGDFDIRTPSQASVVSHLALAYETFGIDWDETTVRENERYVAIRQPDGVPDIVQQVAHGALQLLAQYQVFGHAIPGIIAPTLDQYTHLGDAGSKTDGLIYDSALDSFDIRGAYSGMPDDRWAFTNRSTALDYGAIAALAAASRVLRGFDDALADSCLHTAIRVWDAEHSRTPVEFQSGNTTGGRLDAAEIGAAVELLLATRGGRAYADRLSELLPTIERGFFGLGATAVRALPYMNASFRERLEEAARTYRATLDSLSAQNPFGVPISTGGWGGSGMALGFAMHTYLLHGAFPEIVGPEYVVRGLGYVLGTHPASSVSMVSGVGTHSMTLGYGNNRADFSFIPGGIVPGIVIVQPDFPELKEDWPFLWFENEYTIGAAALYVYVANAVGSLFKR